MDGKRPDYRIRLFMSVDLVGSTAFKAKYGESRSKGDPYPIWLNITKDFYRVFPEMLASSFSNYLPQFNSCKHLFADRKPQVWKTVGDEIIFCNSIVCLEHLAVCTRAFHSALAEYGEKLQIDKDELDVKGCAWLASFPAPNATIISASHISTNKTFGHAKDELTEDEEREADVKPGKYDFLGKSIDTGFRISKFSQASEMSLSIELAWLLAVLRQLGHVDFQFSYKGRESLKGVINNIAYPIVTIETERAPKKKELSSLERNVMMTNFAEPVALRNYLHSFMDQHKIDIPIIGLHNEAPDKKMYPKCYESFVEAWDKKNKEEKHRSDSIIEGEKAKDSETPPDAGTDTAVSIATDKIVKGYHKRFTRPEEGDVF